MTKVMKTALVLAVVTTLHVAGMLAFRAFIYADMYIAPGEPFGISDLIELLLYGIFFILLVISVVLAIVLFVKRNRTSRIVASSLFMWSVALFVAFEPLHDFAATLG
jgi:magnesium-transporting ATPase (P-type)